MESISSRLIIFLGLFFQSSLILCMDQQSLTLSPITTEDIITPKKLPQRLGSIQESIVDANLSEDEQRLLVEQNFSPDQLDCCTKAIVKLKNAGIWTKELVKSQIFNLLAIQNAVICIMIIFDYIKTHGDKSQPQITPQWIIGIDSAITIGCLASTTYAQWCRNKLEKLKNKLSQNANNIKSSFWNKIKSSIGYIYSACEISFCIAAIGDTLTDKFDIPLEAYFIDYVQSLFFATAGTLAAGYYQRKLSNQENDEKQKELCETLIDSENSPA